MLRGHGATQPRQGSVDEFVADPMLGRTVAGYTGSDKKCKLPSPM